MGVRIRHSAMLWMDRVFRGDGRVDGETHLGGEESVESRGMVDETVEKCTSGAVGPGRRKDARVTLARPSRGSNSREGFRLLA